MIALYIVAIIWLTILSVYTFRMIRHYNELTKGVATGGLKEVLEHVLHLQKTLQKEIHEVTDRTRELEDDGLRHAQRIGIVRFNPFSDTGGSQSFTMAILDGRDNGIVMTSLYARNSNRWYVKEIIGGKGKELALSKEEEAAIKKAQPIAK